MQTIKFSNAQSSTSRNQSLEAKTITGKLRNNVWWKPLRRMDTSLVGRQVGHQSLPDEFASMLVELFSGNPPNPLQPAHLTGQLWSMGIEIYSGQTEAK